MRELIRSFKRKTAIARDRTIRPITSYRLKKRLNDTDFTVVSSNCIGAKFYQELGLTYNTPFVGLFIYAPCYIRLLSNLDHYLGMDLTFTKKSKYEDMIPREKRERQYPIGKLGDDVEIQFLHYEDESTAKAKWTRRISRMNMNKLYYTFTDRDLCNEEFIKQFDQMPFQYKVCFTAKEYPELKSTIWINEYRNEPHVGDLYTEYYNLKKHFDFVDWLNGGTGRNNR